MEEEITKESAEKEPLGASEYIDDENAVDGNNETVSPVDAGDEENETGLRGKLEEAYAKSSGLQDRYMRSLADQENLRKRMAREKDEIRLRSKMSVIEDVLPTIDNLKLGLQASENVPEAKIVVDGIKMVLAQLLNSLKEHGLEEVDPQGKVFDPNLHEGVSYEPSEDQEEGNVISTTRIGYTFNGKLLRPAMVVVSKGKEA